MPTKSVENSTTDNITKSTSVLQAVEVLRSTESPTIGKIAQALCKAQLKMGKAQKSADNPYFKSKYADLSACIDTVLPVLNAEGIALIQGSDYNLENKAFFVTTTLIHTSGEWLKSKLFVPITKHDAQGVGAAQTYGRRYLLASMCALGQEDDDGNSISLNKLGKGKKAGVPKMATTASPSNLTATAAIPQPRPNGVKPKGAVPAKVGRANG